MPAHRLARRGFQCPGWLNSIFIAFALAALLLSGGCARLAPAARLSSTAQAGDLAAATRLADRFDSLRTASRIPGLAVVILRDTTVILARGLGHANLERSVPVTPETPFNIASVAKPISAVVALRQVKRGQLDLDRPMTSYAEFKEFCANARERGGLFFRDYECERYVLTLRHVMSMTANGEPGTRFFYNPVSYSWLRGRWPKSLAAHSRI